MVKDNPRDDRALENKQLRVSQLSAVVLVVGALLGGGGIVGLWKAIREHDLDRSLKAVELRLKNVELDRKKTEAESIIRGELASMKTQLAQIEGQLRNSRSTASAAGGEKPNPAQRKQRIQALTEERTRLTQEMHKLVERLKQVGARIEALADAGGSGVEAMERRQAHAEKAATTRELEVLRLQLATVESDFARMNPTEGEQAEFDAPLKEQPLR